ncbi:MAG: PilN domain-containing protein [Planctomycetaceae bacterium]
MTHHLNLLPGGFLKRSLIQTRLKQWGAVFIALWGAILFYYGAHNAGIQREVKQTELLKYQVKPLLVMQAETTEANTETTNLRKRQQLGVGLEHKNIPLQAIGKVSEAASTQDGDLYLTSFILSSERQHRQHQLNPAGATKVADELVEIQTELKLVLDGMALDDLIITAFIDDMNETGFFRTVELISIKEQQVDDRQVRIFNIECKL